MIVSLIVIKSRSKHTHMVDIFVVVILSVDDQPVIVLLWRRNKLNRMSIVIRQVDSKDSELGIVVVSFSTKATRALRFCDSKHAIWSRSLFSGVLNHMLGDAINFWSNFHNKILPTEKGRSNVGRKVLVFLEDRRYKFYFWNRQNKIQ